VSQGRNFAIRIDRHLDDHRMPTSINRFNDLLSGRDYARVRPDWKPRANNRLLGGGADPSCVSDFAPGTETFAIGCKSKQLGARVSRWMLAEGVGRGENSRCRNRAQKIEIPEHFCEGGGNL
jgi:hypothetical protein